MSRLYRALVRIRKEKVLLFSKLNKFSIQMNIAWIFVKLITLWHTVNTGLSPVGITIFKIFICGYVSLEIMFYGSARIVGNHVLRLCSCFTLKQNF